MNTMPSTNYFELFGLTPRFTIDLTSLEQAFHRLQAELHPDRHAGHSEAEQRIALQLSTIVNDGYRTLRHPASRAQFLLSLSGKDDANVTASPAFLMSQMEWREAIAEASASNDIVALEALAKRLKHKVAIHEKNLAATLDRLGDSNVAMQQVNELRFYEKLRSEIVDAQDRIDL